MHLSRTLAVPLYSSPSSNIPPNPVACLVNPPRASGEPVPWAADAALLRVIGRLGPGRVGDTTDNCRLLLRSGLSIGAEGS